MHHHAYCPDCGREYKTREVTCSSARPEIVELVGLDRLRRYEPGWKPEYPLPRSEKLWSAPFAFEVGHRPDGQQVCVEAEIRLMNFQLPEGTYGKIESVYVGEYLAEIHGQGWITSPLIQGESEHFVIPPYAPPREDLHRFLKSRGVPHDESTYGFHVVTEVL